MGINYFIILVLIAIINAIHAIYSYLSNKKTTKIVEGIEKKIDNHIKESKLNQECLINNMKMIVEENKNNNEKNTKFIISRVDHENNNLKYLGDNIYLFHKETDETLKRIEDKIN